ncbi:MAG: dephospho-CoA kinase [Bacteroidaceae bacterium]|nr:dephospho-CoA kinase [Bacteroidaceae bacterium]
MISIAITGGIGSGKSYVSALLQKQSIPIYNADDEAKRLMLGDEGIREGLIDLLGDEVYTDGNLNKPLLASYLFADAENAARINSIVHPRVKADFRSWLKAHQESEIAALECAILYESGFEDTVDFVVMVYAPEELRVERAMRRDNATEQQIRVRIAAQMNDEEKCRRADYVVFNDGSIPLERQLADLIAQLKTRK